MFNWCLIIQTFKEVLPSSLCMLSCVRLFETPWTVAHQVPLSMEYFRQEDSIGLPFSYSKLNGKLAVFHLLG